MDDGRWTMDGPEAMVHRPWSIVRLSLLGVAIFCLALLPRLAGLDLFPTSDEDSWMRRSGGFAFGLTTGQLGRTYQNGHPGVTTMWTAILAQGVDGAERFADRVHGLRYVAKVPGYMDGLAQARIGFAVLAAIGVAVSSLLVARLFGLPVALLSGLGLAVEPFLVANTQLVHVDGPLTTFIVIAVIAAVVRWVAGGGRWAVGVSGVATGLALLSKSPALFLLAFVPLVAVTPALVATAGGRIGRVADEHPAPQSTMPAARAWRGLAIDLAIWVSAALITVVALWPAWWALGPLEVVGRVAAFTRETGAQPDEVGSFFLGRVGADPGPLYYPLASLFRLSPFSLFGILLLAPLIRRMPTDQRARVIWLAAFVVGFAAMMTLGAKKFDRYLLPSFSVLVVLAALGWWLLIRRAGSRGVRSAALAGVAALAIWPLISVFPYPLAFYNPLLGGGAAAQRAVMVGNGEGLDEVARWLRAQPGAAESRIAAHSFDILAALIPGDGEPLRDGIPDDADYIVTYGRRIQMRRWGPSLDRFFQANPPLHTVWINGIEYARIHPGPHLGAGR